MFLKPLRRLHCWRKGYHIWTPWVSALLPVVQLPGPIDRQCRHCNHCGAFEARDKKPPELPKPEVSARGGTGGSSTTRAAKRNADGKTFAEELELAGLRKEILKQVESAPVIASIPFFHTR